MYGNFKPVLKSLVSSQAVLKSIKISKIVLKKMASDKK